MIARLRGSILERDLTGLVVEAAGVGYAVSVPLSSLDRLQGETVDLYIHTEVRQDAIQLYGFATKEEREVFRKLLSVQGVGPSTAVAILSGIALPSLVVAVRDRDLRALQGIPRVGKKTAERICVELSGAFAGDRGAPIGIAPPGSAFSDALSALENLGYRSQDARAALERASASFPDESVSSWVRLALKDLAPKR